MPQFPLDLKSQVILVGTTLVGPKRSHNVVLILDTGATYSMIAPEILVRIGIDHNGSPPKRAITTASGIEYVPFLRVPVIKALGVEQKDVEVCAHSLPANIPASGLLGLNFLRNFNVHLNFLEGTLHISSKPSATIEWE